MKRVFATVAAMLIAVGTLQTDSAADAQSAVDLLSAFDTDRLDACFPIEDSEDAGDVGRLLYRLQRIQRDSLQRRVDDGLDEPQLGDAVQWQGTVKNVRKYRVPDGLATFLEFEHFYEIQLEPVPPETANGSAETQFVFTAELPGRVVPGDAVRGVGVVLEKTAAMLVIAAGRIGWTPAEPANVGQKLLAEYGAELSEIVRAGGRDRQSLSAEEAEAFYSMLSVADLTRQNRQRATESGADFPAAQPIKPIELLKDPDKYRSEYIRMDVSTVRVTRVTVSDPQRQRQIGQDHYFQIDASGDLGDTIVELRRPGDEDAEPIRMSGIYPVSLVSTVLPEGSRQEIDQGKVTAVVRQPVRVNGFFYRLWSYESEFMNREGGANKSPRWWLFRIGNRFPQHSNRTAALKCLAICLPSPWPPPS